MLVLGLLLALATAWGWPAGPCVWAAKNATSASQTGAANAADSQVTSTSNGETPREGAERGKDLKVNPLTGDEAVSRLPHDAKITDADSGAATDNAAVKQEGRTPPDQTQQPEKSRDQVSQAGNSSDSGENSGNAPIEKAASATDPGSAPLVWFEGLVAVLYILIAAALLLYVRAMHAGITTKLASLAPLEKLEELTRNVDALRQENANLKEALGQCNGENPMGSDKDKKTFTMYVKDCLMELLDNDSDPVMDRIRDITKKIAREAIVPELNIAVKASPAIKTLDARLTQMEQQRGTASPVVPVPRENGQGAGMPPGQDEAVLALATQVELRVLEKAWAVLMEGSAGMALQAKNALNPNLNEDFEHIRLALELAAQLEGKERLGAMALKTFEPVRRFLDASQMLGACGRLKVEKSGMASGEILERLREANIYLGLLRFSEQAREPLAFQFHPWLVDQFPRLADTFYREYQTAQRLGTSGPLEQVRPLVDRLLELAGLRLIPIELGRTIFDGRSHIARSTANDPSMPDGTIAGVVKNGFEKSPGGGLAQQAEVIVNRI